MLEIKEFTKKELYNCLQYITYCQFYEQSPKACETYKQYQDFLNKHTKTHMGDCTKQNCPCVRCQLHMIEIESQNALEIIWNNPVGHCGKKCISECEGATDEEK